MYKGFFFTFSKKLLIKSWKCGGGTCKRRWTLLKKILVFSRSISLEQITLKAHYRITFLMWHWTLMKFFCFHKGHAPKIAIFFPVPIGSLVLIFEKKVFILSERPNIFEYFCTLCVWQKLPVKWDNIIQNGKMWKSGTVELREK